MVESNTMEEDTNPTLNEEYPKPVKKTKKKKTSKKTSSKKAKQPQEPTPTILPEEVVEEIPQTVFTLPVKPDEWLVHPATYTPAGEKLTEDTFVYIKDGIEVVSVPFTQDNFEGLQSLLSTYFVDEDKIADLWTIKEPLNAEIDPNPVMSLTRNGVLLATTPLDQKALKQMVRTLNSYIVKPPTFAKTFTEWWMKHKVLRVLLTIGLVPVALAIAYAIIWGLQL